MDENTKVIVEALREHEQHINVGQVDGDHDCLIASTYKEAADIIEKQAARIAELEKDAAMLDWLERHPNCEPGTEYDDERIDRVIFRVTGSPNDREWTEIGRGPTLRDAVHAAMRVLP